MILLSFDIEEFDAPTEYGAEIGFDRQISLSAQGLDRILDLLQRNSVRATFFTTANFAINSKEQIRKIVAQGHEIASHGYYHTGTYDGSLADAKRVIEDISSQQVFGYRSPRMSDIDNKQLKADGYKYNSSMNPTFLPGRYNHLNQPRSLHYIDNIAQLPASVSAGFRIPLFWLALHNMPLPFYKALCKGAIKRDGYLNVYFHPWEFCDALHEPELKIPFIIKHNSGLKHVARLESVIKYLKKQKYRFGTIADFLNLKINAL